jgi:hypothetical protein
MIDNFPHKPPERYSYWVKEYKRNVMSIWLQHPDEYVYTTKRVSTIWGFYHTKKKEYYAPINSKKIGDRVDINRTTPYTAMQLNLNPLEKCLMSLL